MHLRAPKVLYFITRLLSIYHGDECLGGLSRPFQHSNLFTRLVVVHRAQFNPRIMLNVCWNYYELCHPLFEVSSMQEDHCIIRIIIFIASVACTLRAVQCYSTFFHKFAPKFFSIPQMYQSILVVFIYIFRIHVLYPVQFSVTVAAVIL